MTTRTGQSPHRPQQVTAPTQIGRALAQLGIELIPAHSPQARGRMERLWEPWQGRLPQELRLAGITTVEAANRFLRDTWLPFHNRTWTVPIAGEGTAFVPYTGGHLDRICALQHERVVGNDNCVQFDKRHLQIPKTTWRYSFAKCRSRSTSIWMAHSASAMARTSWGATMPSGACSPASSPPGARPPEDMPTWHDVEATHTVARGRDIHRRG
ncbi:MAG TPA: hypothetical protein VNK46_15780 [Nitrospiraceae bacterium]|nr:hypothetical protein [Nitrospiraceae bacterium]